MKIANEVKKVTEAQINKIVGNEELSKSKKMIHLFEHGLEVKQIANIMQVRYNFVYNVVSNHVNMNGIEVTKEVKQGKKEQIIKMFTEGKSNKEISIDLKTNYNYVFNTIKQYKLENGLTESKAE